MRNGVLKAGGTIKYPGMALMSATTVILLVKQTICNNVAMIYFSYCREVLKWKYNFFYQTSPSLSGCVGNHDFPYIWLIT